MLFSAGIVLYALGRAPQPDVESGWDISYIGPLPKFFDMSHSMPAFTWFRTARELNSKSADALAKAVNGLPSTA